MRWRYRASYSTSYDSWGNQTSRGYNSSLATLSYDVLDHLVTWSTSSEQYLYDATGERVLKCSTSGGVTSITTYAFGLEEHGYTGSGANQSNSYYYSLAGHLIGRFDGTDTQFYLTDALGSVLATFNATAGAATILGNQTYGP